MNFKNLLAILIIIIISCHLRNIDGGKKGRNAAAKKEVNKAKVETQKNPQTQIKVKVRIDSTPNEKKAQKNELQGVDPGPSESNPEPAESDLKKDFTAPMSVKHPKHHHRLTILDFAIREIIFNSYRNPLIKKFGIMEMNLITPFLISDNQAELQDDLIISLSRCKGKIIIMPIYLGENKHAVVLIADIDRRTIIYYDPTDPEITKPETDETATKFVTNFVNIIIYKRNLIVSMQEKIDLNIKWKLMSASVQNLKLPPKIKQPIIDYGIHAIQLIDYLITGNGKLSIKCTRKTNLNDYRIEVRNALLRRLWNDSHNLFDTKVWKDSINLCNTSRSTYLHKSAPPGVNSYPRINYEDYINENKDLTAPFDMNPPKRDMCCLIDYMIIILLEYNEYDERGYFIYLPMHLISPYLVSDKKLEKDSHIYSYPFKNHALIMPIYRPSNHTCVLVAYVQKKIVEYYNPIDPDLKTAEAKIEADKIFKRFIYLLKKWNANVDKKKQVDCEKWKMQTPKTKIPQSPSEDSVLDFGVHAVQFIDYVMGHGELALKIEENIKHYYSVIRHIMLAKMWCLYNERTNKQVHSLVTNDATKGIPKEVKTSSLIKKTG